MIDLWPLLGVLIITVGMALRLNTLLVILVAGIVSGLIASMPIIDILSTLGESFTKNRYMSLFILILPMIGALERFGLRERAKDILLARKNASVTSILMMYLFVRKSTNAAGLQLGGHPSMVRPLVAPMAEAAAHKNNKDLSEKQKQSINALSAASENFGNFYSQLIFIAAGGLLLIKGVLEEQGYDMPLDQMFVWAIPTMLCSIIIFYIFIKIEDKKLQKTDTKIKSDEQQTRDTKDVTC